MASISQRILSELGLKTLFSCPADVHLLLLTRFLRMAAYGSSTLILALYFAALGHSDEKIGLFMSLTLAGDVLISLVLTFVADALGRRRIILIGALMMEFSGVAFALTSNYWVLLAAAVLGVISPSGNEIGPFRAIEESTLAHLVSPSGHSDVFAWYVVVGTLGTASGALVCGWTVTGLQNAGWEDVSAYRIIFWLYAAVGIVKAGLTLRLSPRCELSTANPVSQPHGQESRETEDEAEESEAFLSTRPNPNSRPSTTPAAPQPQSRSRNSLSTISARSRLTLLKLCSLFSIDSLASGMAPISLITFYIATKHSIPESRLGAIISAASFASSLGNVFASSVAKRIGLVRTMVFTHLPSAVFLALLPLPGPNSLWLTVLLLVARASLASMDQAPRTAFLAAVVLPEERTAVMGVVNTVKTTSQSAGPLITGVLAGKGRFWIAFVVAGSLKIGYDLGMLAAFVGMPVDVRGKARERERGADQEVELQDSRRSAEDSSDSGEEGPDYGRKLQRAR